MSYLILLVSAVFIAVSVFGSVVCSSPNNTNTEAVSSTDYTSATLTTTSSLTSSASLTVSTEQTTSFITSKKEFETTFASTLSSTKEADNCHIQPCYEGSVCLDNKRDFFCLCAEGFTGVTCNQTVTMPTAMNPGSIQVYPDRGPIAGGTNLTINRITGIGEIGAVVLKISPEIYKLCEILHRDSSNLIARTPPHPVQVTSSLVLSININGTKLTWNTGYNFTYKSNPTITDIRPNSTIVGGGTRLTVVGTSMDAVVNSSVKYQVTNCPAVTFVETCEVHNADRLFCRTPNVSVCKQYAVPMANATLRMTIVGFILDGHTKYNNLSKACSLPNELTVYDPPVLEHRNSTTQYKKGTPLEIKGEHLNRGVTVGDYLVYVGAGLCDIDEESFSASALSCLPPKPIPKKSDSSPGKYRVITVEVGNYVYSIGEMSYPWWFDGAVMIPAIFGAVLIVICVVMTPILIRTYRNRYRQITATNYFAVPRPVVKLTNYFETYEIEMKGDIIEDGYSDASRINPRILNTSSLKYYEPGQATAEFFQEFFTEPEGRDNNYRSKYGKRWSEHFDGLYKSTDNKATDNDTERQRQSPHSESWQLFHGDGSKDVEDKEGLCLYQCLIHSGKPGNSVPVQGYDLLTVARQNGEEAPFYVNLSQNRNEQHIQEPVYVNVTENIKEQVAYGDVEETGRDHLPADALLVGDILEKVRYQEKEDETLHGNTEQNRDHRQYGGEPFRIDIPAERIYDQGEDASYWVWESVDSADLEHLVSARPRRLPRISVGEDDIREVDIDFDVPGVVYVSEHHRLTAIPSFKQAVKSRPSYRDNYRNNNIQ